VHVFGCPANIRVLAKIARKHNLKLIFDSAHGFGASYHGNPLGRNGEAEVFSLTPTKLAPAGEGGIVATRSKALADELKIARDYGNPGDYDCAMQGMNARLCEWSAVFGWEALQRLPRLAERRRALVERYRHKLNDLPGLRFQHIPKGRVSSYKDLSIVIDPAKAGFNRDQLAGFLRERNIDSRMYFSPPVHRQKVFQPFHKRNQLLPVTDQIAENIISLPLYSHQKVAEVNRVAKTIHECYRQYAG
jgi:dTDP-4-amino-4,6-dideoxygalactose transaminase